MQTVRQTTSQHSNTRETRSRFTKDQNDKFCAEILHRFSSFCGREFESIQELFETYKSIPQRTAVFQNRTEFKHFLDMHQKHFRDQVEREFLLQYGGLQYPSLKQVIHVFDRICANYDSQLEPGQIVVVQKRVVKLAMKLSNNRKQQDVLVQKSFLDQLQQLIDPR
ncbi:Hypothetical_protein [Hexamita inflata]|uniref:Hypothetical_protein n=1 Tax=Hexamita inflata TaxID=28002 RepID=A0AA86UL36_9EUKA|nr:Hypothetical protein HINF_LOCUS31338 [Hexamita inflata]